MSDSNVKTFLFRQKENLRACLDAQQSRRWKRFLEQSQYWKPEQVAAYLREADMKVRVISWNKDFDVEQKSYLFAGKL